MTSWRLGGRTRKALLLTHIIAAGTWLGLDVAMAVLIFTGMGTDDVNVKAFTLQALKLVTVWPMFISGVLSLITGILLSLGSKYGLVKSVFKPWGRVRLLMTGCCAMSAAG